MSWLAQGKDGLMVEVADNIDPSDPVVKQMLSAKRAASREQMKREMPDLDPTVGMGMGGKLAASVGAGLTNVGQGVQQLMGGKNAPTSQDVEEKRARDEQLKASTDLGVAPDWMPRLGGVAEFAGEMAPTLPLSTAGLAARGASMAGRMGAPQMLTKALGSVAASPVKQAMVGGAAQGALQPLTEDESRGGSAIGGGLVGGAIGKTVPALTKAVRAVKGRYRAEDELLRRLENEAGGNANYVEEMKQRLGPKMGPPSQADLLMADVPETAVTRTGSAGLARVQNETQGARAVAGDWDAFNKRLNESKSDVLTKGLAAGGDRTAAEGVRKSSTDMLRDTAMSAANQGRIGDSGPSIVGAKLNEILQGDAGSTPAVRRIVTMAQQQLNDIDMSTPNAAEKLYALRKTIDDLLYAKPMQFTGDMGDLSNSAKMAKPQAKEIKKAIDEALDSAAWEGTGNTGMWTRYTDEYKGLSRPVETAKASEVMGEQIFTAKGKELPGGVKDIKTGPLAAALAAEKKARFYPNTPTAAPESLGAVESVLRRTQQEEAPFRLERKAGRRQGETEAQMADQRERDIFKGLFRAPARWAGEQVNKQRDIEVTRMLQNPEQALLAIQMAQRARRPLSPAMQEVAKQLGIAGAHTATQPTP